MVAVVIVVLWFLLFSLLSLLLCSVVLAVVAVGILVVIVVVVAVVIAAVILLLLLFLLYYRCCCSCRCSIVLLYLLSLLLLLFLFFLLLSFFLFSFCCPPPYCHCYSPCRLFVVDMVYFLPLVYVILKLVTMVVPSCSSPFSCLPCHLCHSSSFSFLLPSFFSLLPFLSFMLLHLYLSFNLQLLSLFFFSSPPYLFYLFSPRYHCCTLPLSLFLSLLHSYLCCYSSFVLPCFPSLLPSLSSLFMLYLDYPSLIYLCSLIMSYQNVSAP